MTFQDLDSIIAQLTLAEKVGLLSGAGACSTASLERLNIPSLQIPKPPGYQFPSATAMGATFDVDLLYRIGQLLGDEGIRKRVHVALAPTVCIQRSPLIGRGFEAFAEDPILSGTLAANYVNGIQDRNVGACIKHYMAHDQSTKATEDDVHMTHRTLREIHLMPFQVAMTKSKPWAIMTAYQMVNGLHVSEDPFLIQQVLRHEWKFDGLVMSDWWGTYSTSEAINAGLDLEMPGPSIWRGKQLMAAVECRKVSVQTVDAAVKNLLKLIRRTRAWESRDKGEDGNTAESRALLRKVTADSIVLLKNQSNVLPLERKASVKCGLIGEHFWNPGNCGGGSSEAVPFYINTPLDAFTEMLGDENIRYEQGCYTRRWTPLIQSGLYLPHSQEPGLLLEWFRDDPSTVQGAPSLHSTTTRNTSMYFSQMAFENVPAAHFIRITSTFIPEKTCRYRFALSVCGKARLTINNEEIIELWKSHPEKTDDTPCFNKLSMERFAELDIEEGQHYDLVIVMTNVLITPSGPPSPGGVRLGGQELRDEDQAITDAVKLAREVDIPVILTGLSSDYEYEASDRKDLFLPGQENRMIELVCRANPNTVVIIQAGMPVQMPWIDHANTLVHVWLGGQETGHGITDVLFGDVNPSGRLSVTFPKRLEDTPAFLNFGKVDRQIVYGEGVFVGYRYYEKIDRPPLFYFGYGLSYTKFEYSNLRVPGTFIGQENHVMEICVDIANTGSYDGSEVVQVYVSDIECSVQRPRKELKAFQKVRIAKGEKRTCTISLDKYALSFWSEEYSKWRAEAGDYAIIIATSADPNDEVLQKTFRLQETFMWAGL
ncbi:glycoside hydrolase superfamily [Ilyonectria robusta]|uniref:glycoside hydrolase superfamily n=1 Tax=Ilyonectria robusta TaxID=1079257 RepID=UPI001E8CF827|nr:glycoside hydrolase superfamily [Ilyonectria robusta]KAH8651670.1 glycoside hydrolase superfamily [Ilyonectria robusta]